MTYEIKGTFIVNNIKSRYKWCSQISAI